MNYAGVIFYNDGPELLELSLLALKRNGFFIIAIDGAFTEFPLAKDEKVYSTDGCLDVARKYANQVIEVPAQGWYDQATKRTRYIRETPTGSYIWAIDSDEPMRPFDSIIPMTQDVYRIMENRFYEDGHIEFFSTVRVYKVYEDLAYKYRHCNIYRMKGHVEGQIFTGLVTQAKSDVNATRPILTDLAGQQIIIDHYRNRRSKGRQEQKELFRKIRKENEYKARMEGL
jgi:hypothetical protein